MRHSFSSPLTALHRNSLYAAFYGGLCFFIVLWSLGKLAHKDGTPISSGERLVVIVAWALSTVPALWYAKRLRRVSADETTLYISNFRSEVSVLLTQVSDVTVGHLGRWLYPTVMTIHLRKPCKLGSEILFIPKVRLYWRGEHPVAREVKSLCERASGNQRTEPSG